MSHTTDQLEELVKQRTLALEKALVQAREAEQARLAVEEQLQEMYINLVRTNEATEDKIQEAESLLEGLKILTSSLEVSENYAGMLNVLRQALDFQHAFILTLNPQQTNQLSVIATTSSDFKGLQWKPQKFFKKVLSGNTAAVFDVAHIPEWKEHPPYILEQVTSALHISLQAGWSKAILIGTHSDRGFFSKKHIQIAERFSLLASQALRNAELMAALSTEKNTLEKRVQERTAEIESIARFPAENPNPVIRISTDKKITYSNRAGTWLLQAINYKIPATWQTMIDRTLALGETRTQEQEFGARVYTFTYSPVKHEGYVNIYGMDITGRRRAENRLKRSESRFRSLFEQAGDAIFVHNMQGEFIDVNQQACDMLGYTRQHLLNLSVTDIEINSKKSVTHPAWQHIKLGSPGTFESFYIHQNGSTIPVEVNIGLMETSAEAPLILAIVRDITERKQVEQAMIHARDQALEASRLKTELLAKVSHELRTPLNAILGFAEMLQEGVYGNVTEEHREATAEIIDSSNYLTGIVNQLLDQAKLDAGKVKLYLKEFNPEKLIQRVHSQMTILAQAKGLELTYDLTDNMPTSLIGDPERLQQILVNFISNAIKFTDTGNIHIHVYCINQKSWAFEVSDTGIGVPLESQASIFEPFKQVDGSATRLRAGTGLGLSIVKQLVDLMDGQVSLRSYPNQGSVFTVTLPL